MIKDDQSKQFVFSRRGFSKIEDYIYSPSVQSSYKNTRGSLGEVVKAVETPSRSRSISSEKVIRKEISR